MAIDSKTKKRTRIGYKIEDGKKIRVSRKSNESLTKTWKEGIYEPPRKRV